MDNDKYGWLLGLLGVLIAAVREVWGAIRKSRQEVRRDEITFLNLAVEDLNKKYELCEMGRDELRDQVMTLINEVVPLLRGLEDPPKRKRKAQG